MIAALSLAFLIPAVAFHAPASTRSRSNVMVMKEFSKALPFLVKPAKLDGTLTGDYGFDPLLLTDTLPDLNYVASSEIKHGRVAMLATVGFLVQQFIHLPGAAYQESNPFKAIAASGFGPNLQIFLAIGIIELATWDKTYSGKSAPGDYGFDPLGFSKGKSAAQIADLKLKELKNGRLAMIAIIGLFVQNLLFDGKASI